MTRYPSFLTLTGLGIHYLTECIAEKVEAEVRENLWRLNGGAPKAPAKAAERAVAVSADDFDDED